jgi:probable rRNA maturation factor
MVKINYYSEIEDLKFDKSELSRLINECLIKLRVEGDLLIEIVFIDKEKIADLNQKFRKKSEATDVLSFPQSQFETQKINILGSIVVCPEIARERRETIRELVKHGLLHLLDYDHEADKDKWAGATKKINHKM